ncbi:LysR family transcriptional regulator [Bradyrhizobium sp. INPA01-394B]|uniref:LysR family transcriptional regulator n=1 Tax=Bradyrhizobium campsiandrae TaxID=1729892 RepID=A0ABR7UGZ8_9BRAD|nr:LysR family transcriptional regulator [Bradyrhizobium campsiandrae]MBC9882498.1 LysR family transcriptional regulator [Bradyrhizobium campsiandrae]MBC9983375.1 LysR family transcriptional regulator [Bradyrhizobium campsiandrae]
MSQFDHLDLDGHLLRLLLAVIEAGSVTQAAQRLGVTQSAVSHLLDKLRAIVGDPLFVKSGRGIVPTARAQALAIHARRLLDELRSFSSAAEFDPAKLSALVTIAANDLQRDLLLPSFLRYVRGQAPGFALRVIQSGAPTAELLRDEQCQLVITPRPPEALDVLQKRLYEDSYRVFYDASQRKAPLTLEDYLAADHVTVLHEPRRPLDLDEVLAERGVHRRFVAEVPGFAGIGPFLRGSTLIATLPSLLRAHMLRDFAVAPVPVACPPMPMFMVWHLRHQTDPMHRWLRQQLEIVVAPSLAAAAEHMPNAPSVRRAARR